MSFEPNHPVAIYAFDSSVDVLPPYSLHQPNGKYHISDLFEKGSPTLPPTLSPPITILIQLLNGHPPSASLLPMMLSLLPVMFSLIQLTPPLSPMVTLLTILTTTPITMMMILHHPQPRQTTDLTMPFPSPAQTPKTLLPLPWTSARLSPRMSTDFGVEHAIMTITSSITVNVIQPNLNILYIRCALMISTHG